ncbi:hypothetical protein EDB92DRAFT_1816331 [Lactarius akahatsu]|uniref:Uncharacterized protein n=1 Tax=Lactarius akahatsu TaxID=416441 RepID=A0AAD4LGL3_9AGAM|nr:hypothetical protein EDB92DRAFT_1816331 [Lactarius akahatsu]
MTSGVVRTALMSIPCVTRTDVRTVVRHLATKPHKDRTGRCTPYRIWPELGLQTEGRVRAALPHWHGGRCAPSLRPCTASASASTYATAPTFSPPFLVRTGGGGCGMNRLMGVGVNAHWGLELELISPLSSPCSSAQRCPSSKLRRKEKAHRGTSSPTTAPRCPPKTRSPTTDEDITPVLRAKRRRGLGAFLHIGYKYYCRVGDRAIGCKAPAAKGRHLFNVSRYVARPQYHLNAQRLHKPCCNLIERDIKCYEGLISEAAEIFDRVFGIFRLLERLGVMKKGKREIEEILKDI